MSKTETHGIRKIARIHDKSNDTYLYVVEFPTSKTETSRLELLPSVVSEWRTFGKKLRDAGAVLPKGKKALTQMLETVASSDAPEEWIYEKQTGWLKGGKAFVRVHGVIGAPEANIIGINQSKAVIDRIGKQALAGTWRAWRDTVAGPARHSTTLMLAICVALAAPLLDVVRRQSFALNCLVPATLERAWQLSWRHR